MATKLEWLNGQHFHSFVRRENDWLLTLKDLSTLSIECLWRLILSKKKSVTSADDKQQFGLKEPCSAADIVTNHLTGTSVASIALNDETLDLKIIFNTGAILEVIPVSSGYEAWSLYGDGRSFVASGGGELFEDQL